MIWILSSWASCFLSRLQEARLEVLKKLLRQREEHHQELNTKRLDRLWAKKQEEKEDKVKKIRNEHIKSEQIWCII